MRNRGVLFVAGLAVFGVAGAQDDITAANRQVFLGAGGQRLQYTEHDGGFLLDSDIGKQAAVTGGAVWQGSTLGFEDIYLCGQYFFARGKTAYSGYLQNPQTQILVPWDSSTDVETADWNLRLGKAFGDLHRTGMLTAFVEAGEHRWVRDSSQSDAPYGYLEVYKHKRVELGVIGQARLAPKLVGALEITAGSSFDAQLSTPALGGGTTFALGAERILGGAVNVNYAVTSRLHARLEYRDTSFRYRQSPVVNGAYEPDSGTIQSTAMLSVGYGF